MDTEIDWRHELDSSFGGGDDLPVGHYVAAGHRAVRRRRVAVALVAASLAVVGGTVWVTSPGSSPRVDAPIATEGPDPTEGTDPDEQVDRREERQERLAELRASVTPEDFLGNPGVLVGKDLVLASSAGAVLQRVPNPMRYTPDQGWSLAIRVIHEGREKYSLIAAFPDGSSTTTNEATGDFAGWLAGVVRTQRTLDVANGVSASTPSASRSDPGTWLALGPGDTVEAADGNVLLEVRADVDLGGDFALGAERTGALRMLVDGRPEHVAYRIRDGRLEAVAGPGSHASLTDFTTWAREQYASGQGVR